MVVTDSASVYTTDGCDVTSKQKQHGGFGGAEWSDFSICERFRS